MPYHHRLGIRLTGSLICSLTGEVLDIKNSETDVDLIRKKIADVGPAPRFMVFRQILKEPQYYCDMFNRLTLPEFGLAPVFCDPHTFACLARAHKDLSNDDQAVLLFAAVPHSNVTGTRCKCDIGFRNDGWNTWSSPAHTMLIQVMRNGSSDIIWRRHWPLPHDVHPGESVLFRIHLPVPEFQGRYRLNIDIARDGVAFSGRPGLHPDATIVAHRAAPPISV